MTRSSSAPRRKASPSESSPQSMRWASWTTCAGSMVSEDDLEKGAGALLLLTSDCLGCHALSQ
eukprot:10287452-Prorocentrum_lima.AAC.1